MDGRLIRGHGFAGGHAGGEVRRELETRFDRDGIEPLLAELRQVDPESAARLHPADTKRILRALEVYLETGETISAHNAATRQLPPRYDAVWIGLQFADRADMKALIDRRVDKMAEEGLLEEVQALLAMGLPRNATAMQAIGYKEFLGVLDGTLTEQEHWSWSSSAPGSMPSASSPGCGGIRLFTGSIGKKAVILPVPPDFDRILTASGLG